MRAIAVSNRRVRFSGAVVAALAGAATRSGLMTTIAGARRRASAFTLGALRSGTADVSPGLGPVASPRRGILQLGRLRGADSIRSFRSTCLEEPSDIRAIRTDLPLATGPLDSRDVFDPNVPRWFVTGDTEQVTTLEGEIDGRVTERVRWTLNFTRLAANRRAARRGRAVRSDLGVVGQPMPLDALRAQVQHVEPRQREALRSAAGDSGASRLGAEEARRRLLQRCREACCHSSVPMRAA